MAKYIFKQIIIIFIHKTITVIISRDLITVIVKTLRMKKPLLFALVTLLCFLHGATHAQNSVCPDNLDFEAGTLKNWNFYTGTCCPTVTNTFSPTPVPGRHTIVSGNGVDPYCGFPIVAPNGGRYSLKLGNDQVGAQAERVRYYIRVPANANSIYNVVYSYAVVFQDPEHEVDEQPRFEVTVFDSATGVAVPCNKFEYVSSASLPGFVAINDPLKGRLMYKSWESATIDLSSMAGRTVALDFTTGDCKLGAHFGYAYLDVNCNFFQSYTLHCANQPKYTFTAPPGFQSYDWWDINNSWLGKGRSITVNTPTTNTRFFVVVTPYPGFGCPDTLEVRFTITNMEVDVTFDTAVCAGKSIQLNSATNSTSGPYTYSWSPPTGLSCADCDDPRAAPIINTKYYVTIQDKDGCKALDSVKVRVDETVTSEIVVKDTVCSHSLVELKNNSSNPPGSYYLWDLKESDGTMVDGFGKATATGKWNKQGLSKIRVKVLNGRCEIDDSVYTYVVSTPQPEFEVFKNECVGTPVTIIPVYDQTAAYHWKIDEQNVTETNFQSRLTLTWNTLGKKKIILKTDNYFGCSAIKEAEIGIQPYPDARLTVINGHNLCKGRPFELEATSEYRYDYSWSPPQYFDNNTAARVKGIAEKTGFVYVDVTNQWDCVVRDSFWINAEVCCDIFLPDAFTPNNDGQNDKYWSPDINVHTIISFMIANRRGQIVYETKNNSTGSGWDGTYKGKPAPADTYNYLVKYKCNGKNEITRKGTLILIR